MKDSTSYTNCHRTKYQQTPSPNQVSGASDDSDQDSSTSKYVVPNDDRKRKDGPGGN